MRRARFLKAADALPDGGGAGVGRPAISTGQVGLWALMAVVGVLFLLFSVAYAMRMNGPDWRSLPFVPWQLWLSTSLLAGGGALWQDARRAAGRGQRRRALRSSLLAGAASLGFLAVQLWSWQVLTALHYSLAASPVNSFFYLITGLHGLHVLGGLVAGGAVGVRLARGAGGLPQLGASLSLCTQYWHFLLVLWLAMFGLLFYLTPETIQRICNGL